MVLELFGARGPRSVRQLMADGDYERAAEALRARIETGSAGPRARLQLADALLLAQRTREGIALLLELAEEHARDGFFAKAIALLRRVEKLEPDRPGVRQKRAELQRRKGERDRARRAARPAARLEIGIEELPEPAHAPPDAPPSPRPAPDASPLGGELLGIVEKALKE